MPAQPAIVSKTIKLSNKCRNYQLQHILAKKEHDSVGRRTGMRECIWRLNDVEINVEQIECENKGKLKSLRVFKVGG